MIRPRVGHKTRGDRPTRPAGLKAAGRRPAPAGFTLIEMLVVIVIISILAALITAAASTALWSAKQTKIKVEVDQLAGAMEAFKQKYGSYPPANLYCYPLDANSLPAANPQLTNFIAKAFPRYAATTMGISTIAEQIAYDLQYAAGVDITVINPQVALVLWLSGFGPDPTDPFNRNNLVVSRSPFFAFDQSRLVLAENNTTSGATAGSAAAESTTGTLTVPTPMGTMLANAVPTYAIGQLVYNAPYGNAAYCYFDYQSYGPLNLPPNNFNPPYMAQAALTSVGSSPDTNRGIVYASTAAPQEDFNSILTPFFLTNGNGFVMPYVFDVNSSGTLNAGDTFCKPTSFQIISAGQDGTFGTLISPALTPPSATNPQCRLYPTAYNYDPPPTQGGSGDDDNVTNFCEKSSLDAAKP